MKSRIATALAVLGLTSIGTANAASIGFDATTFPNSGTVQLQIILDLVGVQAQGGGAELTFSGGVIFVGFAPSVYFNTFDTDPTGSTDFSGFGDPPGSSPFEIYIGAFSGLGGSSNSLGTLTVSVSGAGSITMNPSPESRWGPFINLSDGHAIAGFGYGSATAVPLPAAAWLFLTALGLAGTRARLRR
ncbi:MAG: hypothetical protein FJ197_10200 [Gammaproteobacteria bacterium]|nr:hypothetical protein [Gammaproteobacteria bacterium]